MVIIVDPGTVVNRKKLINTLEKVIICLIKAEYLMYRWVVEKVEINEWVANERFTIIKMFTIREEYYLTTN